jgi:hypothetical protein
VSATQFDTSLLRDGILSADTAGRVKMSTNFFDAAAVLDKFAAASIPPAKVDLTQPWNFTNQVAVTAGQLAVGTRALTLTSTLPTETGQHQAALFSHNVSAGSLGTQFIGFQSDLGDAYVGSGVVISTRHSNGVAGTGGQGGEWAYFGGGNYASDSRAVATTAGVNVGATGSAFSSSTLNVGVYGTAYLSTTGRNVGGAFTVSSGTHNTGLYIGGDLAPAFVDCLLHVDNVGLDTLPIAVFQKDHSDVVRIESNGRMSVAPAGTLTAGTSGLSVSATYPISSTLSACSDVTANISAGSGVSQIYGVRTTINGASYTGAGRQIGHYVIVNAPGTGTNYFVGTGSVTGNIGAKFDSFPTTAGTNVGVAGAAGGSTGLNIAAFAKGITATSGKNVGLLCVGRNASGVGVSAYVGMDSADPSANIATSTALLVTNSAESVPIAIFRNNTTDKVRIEQAGQFSVATSTASAPSIAHIGNLNTGINFPSNDHIDLVSAGTTVMTVTASGVSMSSNRITNLADPVSAQDGVTKAYADALINGLSLKTSARLATAAPLPACTAAGSGVGKTLTGNANGALSADGVAVNTGDRLLVKDQATASDNGPYVVTAAGVNDPGGSPFILTRTVDADQNLEVKAAMYIFIEEGTQANEGWILTTVNPITVDTTALTFVQFTGAGEITAGAGLTKTGNTIDVIAGDSSIVVNADELHVGLATNGGLQTSSGLQVQTYSGGAITTGASGIQVVADSSTIEINANALQLKDAGVVWAKLASAIAQRLGRYDRREDFTGTGSLSDFDLAVSDADTSAGGILAYVSGVLQREGGGADYVVSDNGGAGGVDRVSFNTPPALNANVSILYKRTGNAI